RRPVISANPRRRRRVPADPPRRVPAGRRVRAPIRARSRRWGGRVPCRHSRCVRRSRCDPTCRGIVRHRRGRRDRAHPARDAIRETRVAEREAGGITQHIGAYAVQVNDRNVVFLDTPGHAAFTMMRARGARVTDVVVLVVAADDGVMPQTREAIDHARAANVPIIVAINKIDKPNASPERVKRELTELNLMPEEWGGQTVTVEVSAKKKQNLELLLEMILLVADIGELKANPKRNASGTVLEVKRDKGRGPVATILE